MNVKKILAAARFIGKTFTDCFLPQLCILCETQITSKERVCPRCSTFLKPEPLFFCPLCRFESAGREGAVVSQKPPGVEGNCRGFVSASRACDSGTHGFVSGRASIRTGAEILNVVHKFKYSGDRGLASLLSAIVLESGVIDSEFRKFEIMCPVPLYATRQRERGFNQSHDIASFIETHSGVPLIPDLLVKLRPTPAQAKLSGDSRRRNLARSFIVSRPSLVSGKGVVLVDDVVTTGSTVVACLDALVSSGAREVLVLAVAA